jgi:hypothetical protein
MRTTKSTTAIRLVWQFHREGMSYVSHITGRKENTHQDGSFNKKTVGKSALLLTVFA